MAAEDKNDHSRHGAALQSCRSLFRSSFRVFPQKMHRVAVDRAFELIAVEVTRDLGSLLFELHAEIDRLAIEVCPNDPAASQRPGSHFSVRLRVLGE